MLLGLLLPLFLLSACAAKTSETTAVDAAQMRENYNAPVAWLHMEDVPDVGYGLLYRQIDDVESFIANVGRPVLLCRLQFGQNPTIETITYLERLAEQNREALAVVLARHDAQDAYFEKLSAAQWPAFYFYKEGQKSAEHFGFNEKTEEAIAAFIKENAA